MSIAQDHTAPKSRSALVWVALAALAFGLLYRFIPLTGDGRRLASFFATEDGYLMLTVSRNMAIGLGMSVSDGTIPTNGIQPLATFLYTIPYLLTGGDKFGGLAGVMLISILVSALAAAAVHRLAGKLLAPDFPHPVWPLLITALWFTGPLQVGHSMNALETGLYTLMVVGTALYFWRLLETGRTYSLGEMILFGSLCGITFLARIDGALFVTALFLVRFIHVQWTRVTDFPGAVREALLPGIISLLWAAPWLIYNHNLFGSIMPISGTAQSHAARFATNIDEAPVKLFETMFPMLPIPSGVETATGVLVLCSLVVPAVLIAAFALLRRGPGTRLAVCAVFALFTGVMFVYYGLFFGAAWFLARYFAPLSPFLLSVAAFLFIALAHRVAPARGGMLARAGLTGALVLSVALLVRAGLPGAREQGHFQVVDWVDDNVAEDIWVGAVQTGTLGYWHDRTINLDGKVNPEALAAILRDGNVFAYVIDSEIQYLADWNGLAEWPGRDPDFAAHFEVIVDTPERNLNVLRRIAVN